MLNQIFSSFPVQQMYRCNLQLSLRQIARSPKKLDLALYCSSIYKLVWCACHFSFCFTALVSETDVCPWIYILRHQLKYSMRRFDFQKLTGLLSSSHVPTSGDVCSFSWSDKFSVPNCVRVRYMGYRIAARQFKPLGFAKRDYFRPISYVALTVAVLHPMWAVL